MEVYHMEQKQFLILDQPHERTTSFLIGDTVISAPSFIPEVKGEEDLEVLLKYSGMVPIGNPFMVPAYRWTNLIDHPLFKVGDVFKGIGPIADFLRLHPVIFYDPPEFFRFTLTKNLVSYALKGNRTDARKFNNYLKKKEYNNAINMVDKFFQPFVERQVSGILSDSDLVDDAYEGRTSHVEEAWLDPRIDEGYFPYIFGIASDAQKMPNSTIIPPVPPLLKSSNRTYLSTIKMVNRATSLACEMVSKTSEIKPVIPYFHLYVDSNIFESGKGNDTTTALSLLKEGLNGGIFSGVAITIHGYDEMGKDERLTRLSMFVNDVVNIAHTYHLPVIMPRSKWHGLYLTDYATQGFSSLMNGNPKYTRRGALKNPDDKYGKTPIIERCKEVKLEELKDIIKKHGECPSIPGLPKKPTMEQLAKGKEKDFRINWSKLYRFIHFEEAKRMRETKIKGIWNPAKLYLNRSENSDFKSI
jgi:hypothetical protein